MPNINGIGGPGSLGPIDKKTSTPRTEKSEARSTAFPEDRVEISSEGKNRAEQASYKEKLSRVKEVRQERIESIRAQIEAGSYDVDSKLEGALDGLLRDIGL
jgi:flagellar biosynthesis anti-sigma factor FlgM